ncbi:MAG: hypothetical protein QM755_15875 [Luteolibacter sp.]
MKVLFRRMLPVVLVAGGWMAPAVGDASVVGLGLMSYPVNLGAAADPAVIPIGQAPGLANHGYGLTDLISRPVPTPLLGWEWKKGVVTNLNLASEFGISLEYPDSTDVLGNEVILHVKAWPRPIYSPYQKEQVAAAAILSLLFGCGSSVDRPLQLKVRIDDPAEQKALSRFAGSYALSSSRAQLAVGSLPGVNWERDQDGILRVKFPQVKQPRREKATPPAKAMVPVMLGGEGEEVAALIPAWERDPAAALKVTWSSLSRLTNAFSVKMGANVNPVSDSNLDSYRIDGTPETGFGLTIWMRADGTPENHRDLLLACWSMVVTDAMNGGRGIDVTCMFDRTAKPWPMFSGWKKLESTELKPDQYFTQHLRYDLASGKLVEGDLGACTLKPMFTGGWILKLPKEVTGAEE